MSNHTNMEPFKELVHRTSRAFYGDVGVNEWRFRNPKDNKETSMAEVVLSTLTRYEWVKERELEKALRVGFGQLQPTLSFLKKEKLVKCERMRQPVEIVRRLHAGATADSQRDEREGDEKTAPIYRTFVFHTCWSLDYGQICSVARYKIFCLKTQIKVVLDSKNRMQEYPCAKCNKRYTALNELTLFSDDGENFLSDNCHGQLVVESDKLAAQAVAIADNNVNCCEKLEEMLQKLEEQIMPLAKQLNRVKELAVPDFGTLEARVETETLFFDQGKIGPLSSQIEQQKNLMLQRVINLLNKKSKMDITSVPSNIEKSSQIGPPLSSQISLQIEQHVNLMLQHLINSSSKDSMIDITSEPSNIEKSSQLVPPRSSQIEQQMNFMQRMINASNKKCKMDITSEPSNNENGSQIGPPLRSQISRLIEQKHTNLMLQHLINSSSKKSKMNITSEPSNIKKSSQLVPPRSSQIEQQQMNLMQRMISSSSNKSKMDITSEPYNNEKSSQVPYYHNASAGLEVNKGGQKQQQQQDHPSNNVHILGQPMSSDGQQFGMKFNMNILQLMRHHHPCWPYYSAGLDILGQGQPTSSQPGVNPLTVSYMGQIKRNNVTCGNRNNNSQGNHLHYAAAAAGLEVRQEEQDINKNCLDCHIGMKRKHDIRELATLSGTTEEFCMVDFHIQTEGEDKDNNDQGWELVEHDLALQLCRTL